MDFKTFKDIFIEKAKRINLTPEEEKCKKMYDYMKILLEWNEKMNLTAITKPEEIIVKHFIDSLTVQKYMKDGYNIIDIGTGAGFPGIPLAITTNATFTLVDSLNKRINFLKEVINKLELNNIKVIHSRAEDLGQNLECREKYDIAISRAVAPINVLSEYLIPFVKVGGKAIFMKGPNIEEEAKDIEKIAKILGGEYLNTEKLSLENGEITRNIVIIGKVSKTNKQYPRKAGTPSKNPIK